MCPCLCSDVLGVRLLVLLRVVLGLCVGDFTTQGRVCLSGFGPCHMPRPGVWGLARAKAWGLGFGPCQGLRSGVSANRQTSKEGPISEPEKLASEVQIPLLLWWAAPI